MFGFGLFGFGLFGFGLFGFGLFRFGLFRFGLFRFGLFGFGLFGFGLFGFGLFGFGLFGLRLLAQTCQSQTIKTIFVVVDADFAFQDAMPQCECFTRKAKPPVTTRPAFLLAILYPVQIANQNVVQVNTVFFAEIFNRVHIFVEQIFAVEVITICSVTAMEFVGTGAPNQDIVAFAAV